MSWDDRDYARGRGGAGRPGGDWRGLRPSLDNPASWSFSIGTYFGINVRVHLVLVLFVVVMLLQSGLGDGGRVGLYYTSILMLALFILVLLHEFGHCFACRSTGGSANEILMWPLGGLAYCSPPDRWTAHLWTVAGGPAVNLVLAIGFGVVLGATTGVWWGVALPHPLNPSVFALPDQAAEWQRILYLFAYINLILLLFNVILPLFPLDGGRIVQALLWSKMGYIKSMRVAVRVGYFGAIIVGIWAIVVQQWMVVGIMVFGGLTCYMTHRQLQYTEEVMGFAYDDYAMRVGKDADSEPSGPSKRELKRAEKVRAAAVHAEAELDRLLDKIKSSGMDSLSVKEKRWLSTQSRKKRQDS